MSFTIQRILGIAPVIVLGLLLLTPTPGLAQATKPDLVVDFLSEPPATGLPGAGFAITARVLNQGTVAAGTSITRFDLISTTGGPSKNLKGAQNIPALASGVSAAPAVTLEIYSDTLPGTYFVKACANGKPPKILESPTGNNCLQSTGTITVHDVPDLLMKMISEPPLQVRQGQTFGATYKVKNQGDVPAAASLVKFSLVPIVGANGIDLKLDDPEEVGTLGPGATFTNTLTLTVRSETVPGMYEMMVCADYKKTVAERDEDDNCLTSVGTVEVMPQPDLLVKKVKVVGGPLTVNQGDSLTIKVVVRNTGLLDAGASTLKFRLASTGVTPQSKNLKGTVAVPAVPRGTIVKLAATPTVDEDTIPGSYIVSACVDSEGVVAESSDGNNCSPAPGTLTVTGLPLSPADLAVTTLTPPPATRLPGETLSLTAAIKNNGTGASPSTTTKFNLVNALVNPTASKNLKGVQIVDPLAAGATNATAVTVEVYSDTVPGSYFLQACADGEKQLHEIEEDDNCRTSPSPITVLPVPDLVMTAIGNPPATVVAGKTFPAATTYSVMNTGAVTAVTSTAKFYLASTVDATRIDLKASVPEDLAVPALDPAQVFNHAVSLKVRTNTPPGSYTLLGCADSGKAVVEGEEDDNCKPSATTVQVTGLPDLIVSAVKLAAPSVTVSQGGPVPITAVVRNQGFANAAGSTIKLSLVVAPGTAAPIKTLLESPVAAIAQGAKQNVPVTATMPSGVPPGAYVVQACVDTVKLVPETTDENNCGTSVSIIQVQ